MVRLSQQSVVIPDASKTRTAGSLKVLLQLMGESRLSYKQNRGFIGLSCLDYTGQKLLQVTLLYDRDEPTGIGPASLETTCPVVSGQLLCACTQYVPLVLNY